MTTYERTVGQLGQPGEAVLEKVDETAVTPRECDVLWAAGNPLDTALVPSGEMASSDGNRFRLRRAAEIQHRAERSSH